MMNAKEANLQAMNNRDIRYQELLYDVEYRITKAVQEGKTYANIGLKGERTEHIVKIKEELEEVGYKVTVPFGDSLYIKWEGIWNGC